MAQSYVIYSMRRRTNFATFISERREKNFFDQKKYDLHYSCKLQCHSLKVSGHTSRNGFLDSHPYSSDDDKAVHIFLSFTAHLVSVLNGLPSNILITYFDVLLTVHISIFISVFNQLDAQNLFHNKFYFIPLHVSSKCAHHQEVKIALHSLRYHHTL